MPKRKILKRLLLSFIVIACVAAVFLTNFFSRRYVLPILMYHSIVEGPVTRMIEVSVDTFRSQMRFLKRHNYNVLPLEEAAGLIRDKKKIPAKTVIITFDDGYKNFYTNAFKALKEYKLPAAMFIITNEIGRPEGDRLSWDEIKIMRDSGLVSFGSHCLGPEPLVNIKAQGIVRKEIFESKKLLEEKLGRPVELFSYPEGKFDAAIKKLVIDAGYSAAAATSPGADYPNDDVFALKRLRISENARNMFIFAVEASGYYTFMKEYKKRKR